MRAVRWIVDRLIDLFGLVAEVLVALAACGLLLLGWWGFRTAPHVTASVLVGVLLFAGYGLVVYLRDVRGGRLAGRLGGAAVVAGGVVGVLLTYLPACACLA